MSSADIDREMLPVFRMHAEAVNRAARHAARGNQAAAEDATQQAFAESTRIWEKFRLWPPAQQRGWLCRRAIDRAIDGWRAGRRMVLMDLVPEDPALSDAEEIVLSSDTMDRCLKVISALPARQQDIAYLCWHEELNDTAIAKRLGINRSTVSRDRQKVVAALKDQLGDELAFPRGSASSGEEAG